MKIGYFGGTFDPIHLGHVAVARAVRERCRLDRILFVPTDVPPHKQKRAITPFIHRYAMVTLALAEARDPRFLPSLLEEPRRDELPRYSVETIATLERTLKKEDQIFFILGIDAFLDIAKWHEPEKLLCSAEFVVVSRPGSSLAHVADALPASLRPRTIIDRTPGRPRGLRTLRLRDATIHLVEGINVPLSATELRAAIATGPPSHWRRLLPRSVADYIQKMHLYEVE